MVGFNSILSSLRFIGHVLVLFLVVFSTISYFLSLILGPVLFFSTSDGLTVASRRISRVPIDLFMAFTLPVPLPINIGILFVCVWAVFIVCVILAWFSRNGLLGAIRNPLRQSLSIAKTNFLYIMPLVATSVLYATVLIQKFQETQGIQTGSLSFPPSTSPYEILMSLAFAPLREELGFRITSIGIPVGILLLILYGKDARLSSWSARVKLVLLAMFSPERAKAKVGFKNVGANGFFGGISGLEWILILLTAVVFGAAHYLLGGGWQLGKISTAFLAGFVLGVLFVTYGAYASILMHWFFDYHFQVLSMASSTYGGLFSTLANIVEVTNLVAGQVVVVIFLIISAVKVANYLTSRASGLTGNPE